MTHSNHSAVRNTIGVDMSDNSSFCATINGLGKLVDERRVVSNPKAFKKHFSALAPALVVLETGTHSRWASRVIRECGHEVIVGNARELKPIFETMHKTDPKDAQKLARLARVDLTLVHPIVQRSEEAQADLVAMKTRSALVEVRTKLVNHVQGIVKPFGIRIPKCSTPAFHYKAKEAIPECLVPALTPTLKIISTLSDEIREADRKIEEISKQKYPATENLKQVPGVGPITSLAFVLLIGDPRRFPHSRDVGVYFGLTSRDDSSGKSNPQLPITKAGDAGMRTLLVSAAHYILGPFGPDSDLRRFGNAMIAKGGQGAKKRAVVAVARKLAVLLHHLWIKGEDYHPLHNSAQERPGTEG